MTPPSERRVFFQDVVKILGIPVVVVAAGLAWWHPWNPAPYAAPSGGNVFDAAVGAWDWDGADSWCAANPHTISFSADYSVMYLVHRVPWTDSAGPHRVTEYAIQDSGPSHIRGAIRGEGRRTEAGALVVWDLVLTSPDSYVWHRTDWSAGNRTKAVTRCPVGTDSLVAPRDTTA